MQVDTQKTRNLVSNQACTMRINVLSLKCRRIYLKANLIFYKESHFELAVVNDPDTIRQHVN
jgi:hypothetical protein